MSAPQDLIGKETETEAFMWKFLVSPELDITAQDLQAPSIDDNFKDNLITIAPMSYMYFISARAVRTP